MIHRLLPALWLGIVFLFALTIELHAQSWQTYPAGPNGTVTSIATSGTRIYIGGDFTSVSNPPSTVVASSMYLAAWDGVNWLSIGALNGPVTDLEIAPDGQLYVAGLFTAVSGVPANGIARWDGTSWHSLGTGLTGAPSSTSTIRTLAFDNTGRLYAGGSFPGMGGVPGTRLLASWNGTTWQSAGDAFGTLPGSPEIRSLLADGTKIYAGGAFASAAGVANTRSLAVWDPLPATWSALGSVPLAVSASNVLDIVRTGTTLVIGGAFTTGFGISGASNIVGFDLSTGTPFALGDGLSTGTVASLSVQGTAILAAGEFQFDGPNADISFVARWNGVAWQSPTSGAGFDTVVRTIEVAGSNVYAGGDFVSADGNSTPYFAFLNQTALPVTLLSFRAVAGNNDVKLLWQTTFEHNAAFFEIQRSGDAHEFFTIATQQAKGNVQRLTTYSYQDKQPGSGTQYYRLIARDEDGSATISPVVSVALDQRIITAFPNPLTGKSFRLLHPDTELSRVRLFDSIGREIPVFMAGDEITPHSSLASGTYFIRVQTSQGDGRTIPLLIR